MPRGGGLACPPGPSGPFPSSRNPPSWGTPDPLPGPCLTASWHPQVTPPVHLYTHASAPTPSAFSSLAPYLLPPTLTSVPDTPGLPEASSAPFLAVCML